MTYNKGLRMALASVMLILFLLIFHGGAMAEQFSEIKDVPASTWAKLAEQNIYFGHQSLGYNILDGIEDIMAENPQIHLNIVPLRDTTSFDTSVFVHSAIGQNYDPQSKIRAFTEVLENGVGEKVDIAFMKFCFLDFSRKTKNVEELFLEYKTVMSQLQKSFPNLKLVHFTAPLTAKQSGLKGVVKKIVGKGANIDNITRQQLTNLLKAEYEAKAPIFDIATIESTYPDGRRESLTAKDGNIYYLLVWDYTDDSGHLNSVGRKIVAERLLLFLVNMLQ